MGRPAATTIRGHVMLLLLLALLAPIPEAAKRLPVAPPPRPGRLIVHEGDPEFDEFVPEFRVPPGVMPDA